MLNSDYQNGTLNYSRMRETPLLWHKIRVIAQGKGTTLTELVSKKRKSSMTQQSKRKKKRKERRRRRRRRMFQFHRHRKITEEQKNSNSVKEIGETNMHLSPPKRKCWLHKTQRTVLLLIRKIAAQALNSVEGDALRWVSDREKPHAKTKRLMTITITSDSDHLYSHSRARFFFWGAASNATSFTRHVSYTQPLFL